MKSVKKVSASGAGVLDFLSGPGEMARRIREYDWADTDLGSPPAWSIPLKTLVGLMLSSVQPMFMAWGTGRTWLYNDAFVPILGDKHPGALGRPALGEVWVEAADALEPLFAKVFGGEPVHMEDFAVTLNRRGRLEEARRAMEEALAAIENHRFRQASYATRAASWLRMAVVSSPGLDTAMPSAIVAPPVTRPAPAAPPPVRRKGMSGRRRSIPCK